MRALALPYRCALFDRGEIPEHVHSAILPSLTFWHLECLASVDAADSGFQPSVPSDLSFSVYGDEVAPGNPVDPLWRLTADKRRIVFDISAREFEECLRSADCWFVLEVVPTVTLKLFLISGFT